MEGLTRLVAESMERHGLQSPLDHRRLQWSRWSRLESSLDLVLVPSKPGLLVVGEEIVPVGGLPGGKRMLAIFHVADCTDLPISMCRLFASGSPLKDRIAGGHIFARYTFIEDDAQRRSACQVFERWLASSSEAATGIVSDASAHSAEPAEPGAADKIQAPAPLPSGF